jgi:hypothetical protein
MRASEERVAALLDRWLASVELHARYADLDDESYARVQEWPKHQRPTRWVVELARVRLLELKRHLNERRRQGDVAFIESLELMGFLTQLLGSENLERFIPLARHQPSTGASGTVKRPRLRVGAEARGSQKRSDAARSEPAAKLPAPAKRKTATAPAAATGTAGRPAASPAASKVPDGATAKVISDAARFLSWGREWPQLAGLIARLADRPPEPVVWKILQANREIIERKARSARD